MPRQYPGGNRRDGGARRQRLYRGMGQCAAGARRPYRCALGRHQQHQRARHHHPRRRKGLRAPAAGCGAGAVTGRGEHDPLTVPRWTAAHTGSRDASRRTRCRRGLPRGSGAQGGERAVSRHQRRADDVGGLPPGHGCAARALCAAGAGAPAGCAGSTGAGRAGLGARGGGVVAVGAGRLVGRGDGAADLFIIPGRAQREPGIHTPDGGYGFRAHRSAMPRNDIGWPIFGHDATNFLR
jgi:hypothetical protein